jgi:site-specific DNA-methyltransferase (adenine-specific)
VLDPFCGSSTTGIVALRLGRKFVGIDLNEDYLKMSIKRLEPLLAQGTLALEVSA